MTWKSGVARVALGLQLLDQLLEGHVLVGEGSERHVPDAAKQLPEGGVARQVCAQDESVDEEADERLQLRAVAVGDGRADDDVVLSRVARQQRLEDG